eukprot:TRINITY_DN1077_c0_g1_i1.p1 TRINITY_DN1077_c0_g1~~TRINITY_DN1077_c0_g1_i1.p1  ORF type:complete len:77 (-),score=3.58 TRINITY_DN1077_c0_g1_i1:301-531(-)
MKQINARHRNNPQLSIWKERDEKIDEEIIDETSRMGTVSHLFRWRPSIDCLQYGVARFTFSNGDVRDHRQRNDKLD